MRKSFARISDNLRARELQILRQLNAIRKQCQVDEELKRNCVQNLKVSYENESKLLDSVKSYVIIDFERVNFANSFLSELSSNLSSNFDDLNDRAYESNTIIYSKGEVQSNKSTCRSNNMYNMDNNGVATSNTSQNYSDSNHYNDDSNAYNKDSEKQCIEGEESYKKRKNSVKKKEPTDDWLESIKTETDAEPVAKDMMEHINIKGS